MEIQKSYIIFALTKKVTINVSRSNYLCFLVIHFRFLSLKLESMNDVKSMNASKKNLSCLRNLLKLFLSGQPTKGA